MTERPYFKADITRLENAFRTAGDDVAVLRLLLKELEHRDGTRAKALRELVARKLVTVLEKATAQRRSANSPPEEKNSSPKTGESTTKTPIELGTRMPSAAAGKPAGDAGILSALDRIRNKLLDLSRRNTLLNYRHPMGRCLRVVDELPDQLFTQLLGGRSFLFEPLPRVPRLDEYTDPAIREFLERLSDPKRPPAKEWAQLHGIAVDYELPAPETANTRHNDSAIQTLLFPQDLETRLRAMAQLARTAIEESGANILYLAFGFLVWRESDDSDEKSWAPLILVPVSLKKQVGTEAKGGRERFRIEYSGEDLQANLSLRERIRHDFSLVLPELEDDDTPEAYFTKCRSLLQGRPTWSITRSVTLGFFQFGKLLMYLDLDPDRWPERGALAEHPLVNRLLRGDEGGVGIGGSEPVDVDKLPLDAPETKTIEECDSSQHAAVIDATRGHSLVIEGPPGTGKSQTITNIIGIALAQGKSVLFVSEKLAALEVVKKRLENAGLGDFCLELHSHKTQKRKFLEDIAKRLQAQPVSPTEATIRSRLGHYESVRSQIAEYLHLVNRPALVYDGSYRELFCETSWLREGLSQHASALDSRQIKSPTAELTRLTDIAGGAMKRGRHTVRRQHGAMNRHPWYGLTLLHGGTDTVGPRTATRAWSAAVRTLSASADALTKEGGVPEFATYGELQRAANLSGRLHSQFQEHFQAAKLLLTPPLYEPFKKLVAWEDQLRSTHQRCTALWRIDRISVPDLWPQIQASAGRLKLREVDLCVHSITQLGNIRNLLERLTSQIAEVAEGAQGIEDLLGAPVRCDGAGLRFMLDLLALAAEQPRHALKHRSQVLETVENIDAVRALVSDRTELLAERARLSIEFDLDKQLDVNTLVAVHAVLKTTRLLSFLDSEWRAASDRYQSLRHKKARFRSTKRKVSDISRLLEYQRKVANFERDGTYGRLLGALFRGLETPADEILAVVNWNQSIKKALGTGVDASGAAGRRLMCLAEEALNELDTLFRSSLTNSVSFVADTLEKIQGASPALAAHLLGNGWAEIAAASASLLSVMSSGAQVLLDGLRPEAKNEPLTEPISVLQQTAEKLANKNRAAFHQKALRSPDSAPWSAERTEAGRALTQFLELLRDDAPDSATRQALAIAAERKEVRDRFDDVARCSVSFAAASHEVARFFEVMEPQFLGGSLANMPLPHLAQRVGACDIDESAADLWRDIAVSVDLVARMESGFEQLRPIAFSEEFPDDLVPLAARYLILKRLADDALEATPKLRSFSAEAHDQLLAAFRQADEQVKNLSRQSIAATVAKRRVPAGVGGSRVGDYTEMALLRNEIAKQRRHLPIRKVVRRAGNALQALKPCFMMGPLSVAQYLDPAAASFDIAIMDEASQMRPEDALGTIARCRQVIVVGDPKQLPPTSFFDRLAGEEEVDDEDDELAFGQHQSILDITTPVLGRTQTLTWHYRSRHESLIAFSNHSFYDKRLLLFPTAHSSAEHLGIRYRRVDGVYAGHCNLVEAQELVRDVVREIKSGRGRSIGIAAVNIQQAELIRDEWTRVTRQLPELQELLHEEDDGLESLFIKNLENVQGDERDVVFVSLTYGRDANSHFFQRFGPINRDDGWRRLNVLFTRAREQMVVFSSMDSEMIVPTDQSKRGVVALRDFLSYCETGLVPEAANVSGRPPESPFEEEVASVVRQFGLETRYQVGVAGFFIDIGVVDSQDPGHYLLGVECDGASYHSTQSVRDRDKIRERILVDLGWRIHRIWSTDWFKHGAAARQRLRQALEIAKSEAAARREVAQKTQPAEFVTDAHGANEPDQILEQMPLAAGARDGNLLRDRLRELKTIILEECPDAGLEACLLADDIIKTFAEKRPITVMDFHRCIPLERRQRIDREQVRRYLSSVLAIVEDT